MWDFFLFCLELEKRPGFYTLLETKFINDSYNNPEHSFVDIDKTETCAKFQQIILNSMVVEARQSFQCFR